MGPARVVLLLLVIYMAIVSGSKDYYELLGVPKTADSREIRKAFKKLAITMHPDKNPDDPDAQEKFLKLKTAYDTLKDQDSRKAYDLYGEQGVKDGAKNNREYQTWNFYKDQFGIYDEDPEIITLSTSDFEQYVRNSYELWFVKFYSPHCSHCHVVAPTWRELGRELNAVVKVAAVNCEEDWILCRKEGISSYPSFILYPNKEKYYGERTTEDFQNFILHKLPARPIEIPNSKSLRNIVEEETQRISPWIFTFCKDSSDTDCQSWQTRIKLSNLFEGLAQVAYIDCSSKEISCKKIGIQSGTVFLPAGNFTLEQGQEIHSLNYQEIATQVLEQLPDAQNLEDADVEVIRMKLLDELGPDWLIYFTEGSTDSNSFSTLLYRRLPVFLPRMNIGQVNCQNSKELCKTYFVNKFPAFAAFKRGGSVEFKVGGGATVSEIVSFARTSVMSPNLGTLSSLTFPECLKDGHPWLIDFYAPWCPPCMKLIPEFRKASQIVGGIVKFGSVDCSVHRDLCSTYNIRAYPTLVFYNQSVPHTYSGQFAARDIASFVEDILRPPVVELTIENFDLLVSYRPTGEIWLIDFFASWCGPCIQLAPQWRRFARMLSVLKNVHVGSVDCVTQELLCSQHHVGSYPTIRLYPVGTGAQYIPYNGFQRDAESLRTWLVNALPSSVHTLNDHNFVEVVLKGTTPWVVDFYAPWCGPCHTFAVDFELAAKILDGSVRFAKVNCDVHYYTCQSAGIRAYPSVRLYPGRTGWNLQETSGIPFAGERRNAEDVAAWIEEILSQTASSAFQQSAQHAANAFPSHDEL